MIEIEAYLVTVAVPDDYDVREHEEKEISHYTAQFGEPPFNDSWGDKLATQMADG